MSRFNVQLKTAERMEKKGLIQDVRAVVSDPRAVMALDFQVTPKGFNRGKRIYGAMTTEEKILIRAYLAELEKQEGNYAI